MLPSHSSFLAADPGLITPDASAHRDARVRPGAADGSTRPLWLGVALGLFATGLLMRMAGLAIEPASGGNLPYLVCGAAALLTRVYAGRMPGRLGRALADGAEYYALFTLIALAGAVTSYPIAGLTRGFHDSGLQRIDHALGFDWLAWYRTVAAHPWLQTWGLAAYRSIYLSPAILLGHATWTGDRTAARRFLAVFGMTAAATLALYAFMPAVGPFSYLWHGPIPYMPESEQWQQGLIPALRDHEVRVIDLAHLRGLVSAPSFHTAAALLYIRAAWPIPRLRWPLLALNVAMLLSTPVEGTHYLADMLIGAAVTGIVVGIMGRRRA